MLSRGHACSKHRAPSSRSMRRRNEAGRTAKSRVAVKGSHQRRSDRAAGEWVGGEGGSRRSKSPRVSGRVAEVGES